MFIVKYRANTVIIKAEPCLGKYEIKRPKIETFDFKESTIPLISPVNSPVFSQFQPALNFKLPYVVVASTTP